MKRFNAGLVCCAVGVMLFAVNWLGAAAAISSVTEWDRSGFGRIGAAFSLVGYVPITFGVVFLIAGGVLLYRPARENSPQPGEASRGVEAQSD